MQRYLTDFENLLGDLGLDAECYIARSDGALMSLPQARAAPLYMLQSGDAAAVTGAACIASQAGYPDAVCFELGSRAGQLALICDGRPLPSAQSASVPAVPALERHPLGGAGAFHAYIAAAETLCFGAPVGEPHAGTRADIADARRLLGYLPAAPDQAEHNARHAIAGLAAALSADERQTAQGMFDMFNETLAAGLRQTAVRQALETRDFALVAGGGAGALHANALALLTGCYPVIVPPAPAQLAALGLLCAQVRCDCSASWPHPLAGSDPDALNRRLSELGRQAGAQLTAAAVAQTEQQIGYAADLRYQQQDRIIRVAIDTLPLDRPALQTLTGRFNSEYQRRHGFTLDAPIELAGLCATGHSRATVPAPAVKPVAAAGSDSAPAVSARQQVCIDGATLSAVVYQRDRLQTGQRIEGPALIVQSDTTTLLYPQHYAEVDGRLNLLIYPQNDGSKGDQPVWR